MHSYPKISIITVVLNDSENFLKTANSVSKLIYKNIEYIVIDGKSTDSTPEIINEYKDLIDKSISERDGGLYDAMNKGIDLASGDWIIFMNAGDIFVDSDILTIIFADNDFSDTDILYGDTIVRYPNFERYQSSANIIDIERGMQFSHQSVFIRLSYHRKNKYNIQNVICADFEFFYDAVSKNRIFLKIPRAISSVLSGGISDKSRELVFLSWWRVVGFKNIKLNVVYFVRILLASFKRVVKTILPSKMVYFVIEKKAAGKLHNE